MHELCGVGMFGERYTWVRVCGRPRVGRGCTQGKMRLLMRLPPCCVCFALSCVACLNVFLLSMLVFMHVSIVNIAEQAYEGATGEAKSLQGR